MEWLRDFEKTYKENLKYLLSWRFDYQEQTVYNLDGSGARTYSVSGHIFSQKPNGYMIKPILDTLHVLTNPWCLNEIIWKQIQATSVSEFLVAHLSCTKCSKLLSDSDPRFFCLECKGQEGIKTPVVFCFDCGTAQTEGYHYYHNQYFRE